MSGFDTLALTEEALPLASGTVPCQSCQGDMPRVLHAQAHTLVCSCKRIYSNSPKGLSYEGVFKDKKAPAPCMPLGSTGILKDVKYRVVGYLVNKEKGKIYTWCEYVLFNPLHGYAFLSEYDGHWSFFRYVGDLRHNPLFEKALDYQNKYYQLFNKYGAEPIYALGEFPWNIMDDKGQVWEFICPPHSLNKTVSKSEVSWMQGEYLQPEVVKKAFGLKQSPPLRVGTGAAEPFSLALSWEKSGIAALFVSIIFLLLHVFFVFSSQERSVLMREFSVPANTSATIADPVSAANIELLPDGFGTSNLEFILRAPVSNSWFSAGITLIHQQTGREYDFEMGVEYYSGYEGGENWSEGSTKDEKLLSAMPAGTYQMLVYPYATSSLNPGSFSLEVNQDVPIWSNFWIIALLIWLVPGIQKLREYYFERSRWANSNYSPYNHD